MSAADWREASGAALRLFEFGQEEVRLGGLVGAWPGAWWGLGWGSSAVGWFGLGFWAPLWIQS